VLKAVDIPDVGAPAAGEVVIALEASPVNQYDLLMIAGGYGYRPRLPAIMGTEGVGRVVAVGAGVKHLKEGDRALVPFLHPAWAERIKTSAPWLRPLPPGDINQFAMMGVNPPTAYFLLTDIVKLPRGSWVIQNGANSGVGRATVAIAKSLGLKTINVVRREEVVAEMKALGGDIVLVDGPDLANRVAAETGNAPITLGARWGQRYIAHESDELPVRKRSAGVLWRNEPQADGRATGQPHFQEADDTWLLASLLVSVSHAGRDHGDVRSSGAVDRLRHDLGSGRRHLRFRPGRRSDRQSRTERRQGAVHAENVICLRAFADIPGGNGE
jgi:hypothetical protein